MLKRYFKFRQVILVYVETVLYRELVHKGHSNGPVAIVFKALFVVHTRMSLAHKQYFITSLIRKQYNITII